jgi:hypothetical protein
MVATGRPLTFTFLAGSTTKLQGAVPHEHLQMLPWETIRGIGRILFVKVDDEIISNE